MAGARTVRLPAHGPGAADRGAGPARAQGGRRHRPRVQRAAPARRLAGHRPDHPPGRRADRRGRRPARDLRAGARLPRRQDRRLPRARRARRRPVADHDPGHRRAGQVRLGGVRPAAGIPPARGQPRGDPGADGAVPGARPIPVTCRSAWTPAIWPTGTRTTWPSSAATPTASGTCTSSRWTRPSSRPPTATASPSGRPWPWAPAASRPAGNPPSRRSPRPWRNSTGTCSWSSSRTCTRPTSTSRSRSPSAPTTTCAASASGRS